MTIKKPKAAKAPALTVDANENVTAIDTDAVAIRADRIDMNDPTKSGSEAVADALKAQ
ncbi:MAG: hypothetical protein ACK4MI_03800 [Brevundimonas sp.]|uniref:hypothetical protein n=1 Tax=Brevundimonas sp. TaxID=1871086 RepID=UPI003919C709